MSKKKKALSDLFSKINETFIKKRFHNKLRVVRMSDMRTYIEFMKNYVVFKEAKCSVQGSKTRSFWNEDITQGLSGTKALQSEFYEKIEEGLSKSKIFEVDDDIKKLLLLTKTPDHTKNEDLHLPFPYIFIDVSLSKEELEEVGITIDSDVDEVCGIILSEGKLFLNQTRRIDVGRDLTMSIMVYKKNKKGEDMVSFNNLYDHAMIKDEIKKQFGVYSKPEDGTDRDETFVGRKTKRMVYNFSLNFLNFINNPEVTFYSMERNNKRRQRQGKLPLPNSNKIKLVGELKRYVTDVTNHTGFKHSHRFWVRGHFRKYKSEKYKKMKGKRRWILPFIKGSGVLIEKKYRVD